MSDENSDETHELLALNRKVYARYKDACFLSVRRTPHVKNQRPLGELDRDVKICYMLELYLTPQTFDEFWGETGDPTISPLMKQSLQNPFGDKDYDLVFNLLPWTYPQTHSVVEAVSQEWVNWAKNKGDVSVHIYEVQVDAWYAESLVNNCPVVAKWTPPSTQTYKRCVIQ